MTKSNNPLVSVYIPSHKRHELARRAIESVLNQTYSPVQILLCNDGSNDSNYLLLKELVENNNGIYIENSAALGAPASRNKAINLAQGYFITGLDDDDEFTPDRIQSLVDTYEQKYSFIATSYVEMNTNGSRIRTYDVGVIKHAGLLHYNKVGNQIFTETERLRSVGGFDESLPAMQDHELWIRMTQQYGDALKYNAPTYIVHKEHELLRISSGSGNKVNAIKTLQNKHKADLDCTHYKTHELIIHRAQDIPFTFLDLLKYINPTNYRLAITSYLAKKRWRL